MSISNQEGQQGRKHRSMLLYHYYDSAIGPFRNLSDLTDEDADRVMQQIRRQKSNTFCAKRKADYMKLRRYYESILREEFRKKGGMIERQAPHYMVVGACPWLASWYENSAFICIPVTEFDPGTISFTYGDSHPTFSEKITDGKEYRKKIYTYEEILRLIDKYGYPQEWNSDGAYGPERYIEAHIWSDTVIEKYGI